MIRKTLSTEVAEYRHNFINGIFFWHFLISRIIGCAKINSSQINHAIRYTCVHVYVYSHIQVHVHVLQLITYFYMCVYVHGLLSSII